jgi:hypothetical protein
MVPPELRPEPSRCGHGPLSVAALSGSFGRSAFGPSHLPLIACHPRCALLGCDAAPAPRERRAAPQTQINRARRPCWLTQTFFSTQQHTAHSDRAAEAEISGRISQQQLLVQGRLRCRLVHSTCARMQQQPSSQQCARPGAAPGSTARPWDGRTASHATAS